MSKKCGLKKTLCPGPLTGDCPFFRSDCKFHENVDTIVVGPASLITRVVQRAVQSGQNRQSEQTGGGYTTPVSGDQSEKNRRS